MARKPAPSPLFVLLALVALSLGAAAPAGACPDRCFHPGHASGLLDHHPTGDDGAAGGEAAGDTEPADWDVNVPRDPAGEIAFTTDQGTWMSVDVSPDGRTLVFDHLGDIWTVGLDGGPARRLTEGLAWDYQPRFSPDGGEILFTSDRSGGVNLWVMQADGSGPEALTDTGEKDTNSGAWSPDGEWIAAKRRLTDVSSIGATELWLHHRRGGDGIRVTEKDKLPEISSPEFGPDGRFLYFAARPSRFAYDRNPHQGLYQIRRFDRQTGKTSPVTDRWGGAGRPRISPDGATLSFVSRDGNETVLVLHDLATGAERVLLRGLDHDLQESFAWAGTYPSMDWLPDGSGLVLWKGGGLWRIDAADGAATPIPFSCDVKLPHQEALRFTPDVAGPELPVRILRWLQASPRDGSLVFAALGRIYRARPDGRDPRVLLDGGGDDGFVYSPSLSPDGKRLAWVSWSDEAKGHVWVGNADGRRARRVSTVPGQWANPAWSADGRDLVVLKGSGHTLRGGDLGGELHHEIWLLDPEGSRPAHFVTTVANRGSSQRMPAPFFGPDPARVWFLRSAKENGAELVSVTRDGIDEKVHVRSKYGEEFALSPDGRRIAFKRLHKAFVAPLPDAGLGTLDLTDADGAVAVTLLADDLVDWLRWEDDETITWGSANEFARQTVAKARAAAEAGDGADDPEDAEVAGDEDEDPNAPVVVTIDLEVPRAAPTGTLVVDGARLITMEGDEVIADGRLVIEGNRIAAVGPAAEIAIPDGAEVLDASGLTAMPGLVDAHAHMGYGSLDILPQQDWQYFANLAYGVTATMDPSASTHLVFAQSEMVEAGVMTGPRVYSTGFILYGADLPGRAVTKTYEDALRHVRRMKKQGAFAIKSYMQPKRIQRQWYVKACREEGMLNFPEGGGNFENNMGMILDGHTGIEHTTPVAPLYDDVRRMWAATGVGYTPTFLVAYGGLSGENWFYQHEAPIWSNEKLIRFTPRAVVEARARRLPVMAYDGDWHHMTVAASADTLQRMGVLVNLGAHGQRQGLGCHWDMWAMAQGGASNHDVLRFGTISPATYIGLGDQLGSLKAGKLADVILLEGDPLADIRQTDTVRWTIKNGEVFDAATMDRTWPDPRPRRPFVWE